MRISIKQFRKLLREHFVRLLEDRDRLRRGVGDNWPGESHDNYEEAGVPNLMPRKKSPIAVSKSKGPGVRFGPEDPLEPKAPPSGRKFPEDPEEFEMEPGKELDFEDKDRMRRAADGHTERVGPSGGKFEEDVAFYSSDEDIKDVVSDKKDEVHDYELDPVQEKKKKAKSHAVPSGVDATPIAVGEMKLSEATPKGWEGTIKGMKKHKDIKNPWALVNYMKQQGYKPGGKE